MRSFVDVYFFVVLSLFHFFRLSNHFFIDLSDSDSDDFDDEKSSLDQHGT